LASADEIRQTPGIGRQMALEVWNYFHPDVEDNS